MMHFRKILRLLVFVFVILSLTGCQEKEETVKHEKSKQVTVVTIQEEAYKETLNYLGFITAESIVPLSFNIDGEVAKINFSEGDAVKKGDVIAELLMYGSVNETNNKIYLCKLQ